MRPSAPPIHSVCPRSLARRAALWAGLVVFFAAGYFQVNNPGWNIASRFDLAAALAERGTFRIDDYHQHLWMTTNDKAEFEGHFYSDKSPVASFAGAPIIWAYRQLSFSTGIPFRYEYALWITTWLVAGGSAAALAALLALIFAERGLSPRRAAVGGAFWIVATPLFGYSTLFYDYLPSCALMTGAFYVAQPAWRGESPASGGRLLGAGLLGGLACWTLNTSAIATLPLTLLVVAGCAGRDRLASAWKRLLPWAAGGIVGAAGNFIYTRAIFGSFRPAYAYEFDPFFREQMAHGLMGAGWPRPFVMWLQTFHPFQGMFLWFPATLAAAMGCLWLIARQPGSARREALAALATLSLFLLYTSGYYMWWGGYSGYAPRHLIPALPILAIGLIPWLRPHRLSDPMLWAAGAAAVLLNLMAVAVNPQYPPGIDQEFLMRPHSVQHWTMPFYSLLHNFWTPEAWAAGAMQWNWGRQLGMTGPWTLAPLLAFWAIAIAALPFWLRERGVSESPVQASGEADS